MKIPLSNRLIACCKFVRPGDQVADIGCDHGYLGIHLLKNCNASAVIAADINQGPLQSAMRNAEKFGVKDRMTFYLSDGARNIPRNFDALVCAGMGGDTMVHILEDAPWLRSERYFLVLQCQSKTPLLRRYLSNTGWLIAEEVIVRDGKFLYTVMKACWQPDAPKLTAAECYLSPAMLAHPGEALNEYCDRIIEGLQLAVSHQDDADKRAVLIELKEKRSLYDHS